MKSVVIIIILFLFNNIVFSFSDSEIKKKAQKDSSIKKTETKILSAKCLLIKENKPVFTKPGNQPYYVFVRVNLKDGWGELVKMGEINKLENVNLKFTETKLKNGEFGFGKTWLEDAVGFYQYYHLEVKNLIKNGFGRMVYISNNLVGRNNTISQNEEIYNCQKL